MGPTLSFVGNNGFSPLIRGNGPSQGGQQTGSRTRAGQGPSGSAQRVDLDAPGRENRPQARGREGSHSEELRITEMEASNVTPSTQVSDTAHSLGPNTSSCATYFNSAQ